MNTLLVGGSGFVGSHLLDVISASPDFDRGANVVTVSRRVGRSRSRVEHKSWDFRSTENLDVEFDEVIFAATPASDKAGAHERRRLLDDALAMVSALIRLCERQVRPPRVLFTSSGAVYGSLDPGLGPVAEETPWAPELLADSDPYSAGKRASERLLWLAAAEGILELRIARIFAFTGAHLPLDGRFAAGSFIHDAVRGDAIFVDGDGATVRTYLDGDDLARWLLEILRHECDEPSVFNVGSERQISILQLAEMVSTRGGQVLQKDLKIVVRGKQEREIRRWYVPSTRKARETLGVSETVSLETSIDRMLESAMSLPTGLG